MIKLFRRIKVGKSGATAAEYALIVAVLGGFVIAGTIAFGNSLTTALEDSGDALAGTP